MILFRWLANWKSIGQLAGMKRSKLRRRGRPTAAIEILEQRLLLSTFYVDNAADFVITNDQGNAGLDAGDTVTWTGEMHPAPPAEGLIFGTTAFANIQEAVNAAEASTDPTDTINVGAGQFVENLSINTNVEVLGAGPLTMVDGNAGGSVVAIGAGSTVVMDRIKIENGLAAEGGGIHNSGTLTLRRSRVENNVATVNGGGIWNGSGALMLEGTLVGGNTASGDASNQGGGGIFNAGGTVSLTRFIEFDVIFLSDVFNNVANGAAGSGGGIVNDAGGTVSVASAIFNNTANGNGGGIEDNSGAGLGIILSGAGLFDNSAVGNGGGLHVTGAGDATITGGLITGNFASRGSGGGGIWNGSGTMTIAGTIIEDNSAGSGGGLWNDSGTVNISTTTISNNSNVIPLPPSPPGGLIPFLLIAPGHGGGIYNNATGTINLDASTVTGNETRGHGGGIINLGTLTVTNSTIDSNTASQGGGIANEANLILRNVTISGNTAQIRGGGVYTTTGTATINNSTIVNNVAVGPEFSVGQGGGIYQFGTATVILNSTIVADNIADGAAYDIEGAVSGTFNLIGVDTGMTGLTHGVDRNIVGTASNPIDPRLTRLDNNGGPTRTHALLPTSIAVNAGDNPDELEFDQRGQGFPRQFGNQTDIGAFELQAEDEEISFLATASGPGTEGRVQVSDALTGESLFEFIPYAGFPGGFGSRSVM